MTRFLPSVALLGLLCAGCTAPVAPQPDALTPAGLPAVPVRAGDAAAHIDRINETVPGNAPVIVNAGEPVTIFGWALDGPVRELASEVYVEIGGTGYRAQYFQPRPDVGKLFGGKAALQYAGFNVTIAGGKLRAGEQTARIHLVTHDRQAEYVGPAIPLTVR